MGRKVSRLCANRAMPRWACGIERLVRPKCSGIRRVLAAIHDPPRIARVLGAMGLSAAVPEQAGCRAPPVGDGVSDTGEGVVE